MTLRRLLIGAVVIGVLAWVISSPTQAGGEAANIVDTFVGWCKNGATAVITFVRTVV
jgi:hypothetical protein